MTKPISPDSSRIAPLPEPSARPSAAISPLASSAPIDVIDRRPRLPFAPDNLERILPPASPSEAPTRAFVMSSLVQMAKGEPQLYDGSTHADFQALDKMGAQKLDKDYVQRAQQALVSEGLISQIPRPQLATPFGTLTHYRLADTHKSGGGNSTSEASKVANLAYFSPEADDLGVLRHAKVDTKEQWTQIRLLAAEKLPEGLQSSVDRGDALAPSLLRYDQKTPWWINPKEQKMARQEREAASASNQEIGELPKVRTLAMTANGLLELPLLHRVFGQPVEDKINQAALQNKTLRALIEIGRLQQRPDIKDITKAFNAMEQGGDKALFEATLASLKAKAPNDRYLDLILGAHTGSYRLDQIGDFMRKTLTDRVVTDPKARALRDGMAAALTRRTSSGERLRRGAELGLHASLDKWLNIISDAGCKSGQDRTLHLYATDMAHRAVRALPGVTAPEAMNFAENFEAIAKAYDANNATPKQKAMMETFRNAYLQTAIEQGLSMTQYSTLLPGLKWHGEDRLKNGLNPANWWRMLKAYLSENKLPLSHIPDSITVAGKSVPLIQRDAFGQRSFTTQGSHYLKALARFRRT